MVDEHSALPGHKFGTVLHELLPATITDYKHICFITPSTTVVQLAVALIDRLTICTLSIIINFTLQRPIHTHLMQTFVLCW